LFLILIVPGMKCRLCQQEKRLIRAHVIPRSFYPIEPTNKQPVRLITNAEGRYGRTIPIGVYDDGILCEGCERLFSPWDDYATETFRHKWGEFQRINCEGVEILRRESYSYTKLKMFFLSVLWRAGVSSDDVFSRVDLGPYEADLRRSIRAGDAGDPDYFGVVLQAFTDTTDVPFLNPEATRFCGVNFYCIYLSHVVAFIKVDARPLPDMFDEVALAKDRQLIVFSKPFRGSKERAVMRAIALADRERRGRRKG
jgi:hypothetical protein